MSERTMLDKHWFSITTRIDVVDKKYFASNSVPIKEVEKIRDLINSYLEKEKSHDK